MRSYLALTLALAAVAIGASFLAGASRRGALLGSTMASFTAVASMLAMRFVARRSKKGVKGALAVMTAMFLLRMGLVAVGTALVARGAAGVFGFVVAFFVPYFLFAAIEGAFVHSLGRGIGPAA